MFIEASQKILCNENVFVSFEKTSIVQIENVSFQNHRLSSLLNASCKFLGIIRNQVFLKDNTWSIRYIIPEEDRYGNSSTLWTLESLSFTLEIFVRNYFMIG